MSDGNEYVLRHADEIWDKESPNAAFDRMTDQITDEEKGFLVRKTNAEALFTAPAMHVSRQADEEPYASAGDLPHESRVQRIEDEW